MDAAGLWYQIGKGSKEPLANVVITFTGRFKGETVSIHHLQVVANNKASKLKVGWWLERLDDDLIRKGHRNVPPCCCEEGNLDQYF